ncbi:hypothetical protein [Rhodococcus sp. USK13]|uniref:hypothetical protein n=1 Tax=Rhodococcus sp. USK13 TaxID=2806442 RepID=UPI001BD01BA4|nr:hypothetical protein [Rhodococcus sp. USK13]
MTRTALIEKNDRIELGRPALGGIHFFGLCETCNRGAGVFDPEYRVLSDALKPMWAQSWTLNLPREAVLPDVVIRPGDIARSILLGMCGVTPLIVDKWPDLPAQLLDRGTTPRLPDDLRLRLALARGKTARVAGPFSGLFVMGPKSRRRTTTDEALGVNSVASVYFPPLAWELVYEGPTMLDADGWADVSSWLSIRAGEEVGLPTLVGGLPYAAHPAHTPDDADNWFEMTSDQIAPIAECANITGEAPDPVIAKLLGRRVPMSLDELEELQRRRRR